MKEIFGNIAMYTASLILIVTIFGIFKPQILIPLKFNINHRRSIIVIVGLILTIAFTKIKNELLPELSNTSIVENDSVNISDENTNRVLNDTLIVRKFEPEYKKLYLKLQEHGTYKKDIHESIKDLFYNKWWGAIEICDSLKMPTKYSRKVYKKCCLEYDKVYAKWIKYGDEDYDKIETWSKNEAERILSKACVDPESLTIENVSIKGKAKNGWKSIVQYRSKNSLGGYVRDYITLIVAYNEESDIYKAVQVY